MTVSMRMPNGCGRLLVLSSLLRRRSRDLLRDDDDDEEDLERDLLDLLRLLDRDLERRREERWLRWRDRRDLERDLDRDLDPDLRLPPSRLFRLRPRSILQAPDLGRVPPNSLGSENVSSLAVSAATRVDSSSARATICSRLYALSVASMSSRVLPSG